jgi:hypothetical protein
MAGGLAINESSFITGIDLVGALAAALSLLRAGLDLHVYEQARGCPDCTPNFRKRPQVEAVGNGAPGPDGIRRCRLPARFPNPGANSLGRQRTV